MKLAAGHNLGYVAVLRHLQSLHELPNFRNPDDLVGHLFTFTERLRYRFFSTKQVIELRSQPFYHYLLARTRYYDGIFSDAVRNQVRYIVNVGCGSDTRAHRFRRDIERNDTVILECDLPSAISVKEKLATRLGPTAHIRYIPLDLNRDSWPIFEGWLARIGDADVLVMMEGVSPYVGARTFTLFLKLLAERLPRSSPVAYDFKLADVAKGFGDPDKFTPGFRLPSSHDEVSSFHQQLGFDLVQFEPGWELQTRLAPVQARPDVAPFRQDVLVRLKTA